MAIVNSYVSLPEGIHKHPDSRLNMYMQKLEQRHYDATRNAGQ